MATGDVEGNLQRLRVQLRTIGYPHALDLIGLKEGDPAAMLPLLHYALLGYSRHVSRYLSEKGYALFAKNDLRFMECTLKFLREEFGYRCPLTVAQIFSHGFAERKFMLVHDVIQVCKRKHTELVKLARRAQQERKMIKRETTLSELAKDLDMGNLDDLQKIMEKRACEIGIKDMAVKCEQNEGPVHQIKMRDNGLSLMRIGEAFTLDNTGSDKGKDAQVRAADSKNLEQPPDIHCAQMQQPESNDTLDDKENAPLNRCYERLRAQIVDVAEKLEKRLLSLEEDVKRMTSSMQDKLGSLQTQTQFLQQRLLSYQSLNYGGNALSSYEGFHLYDRTVPLRRSDESLHLPVSHINSFNQNHVYGNGMTSLETPQFQMICNTILQQQNLSTQELIACVKARCNKTKELLSMDNARGGSILQPRID